MAVDRFSVVFYLKKKKLRTEITLWQKTNTSIVTVSFDNSNEINIYITCNGTTTTIFKNLTFITNSLY